MYFTKVELHNFGIYKGTHEMLLTDKVGNKNITLIGGLNGRGKTTFHDAILIALYGSQALKYINEKARSYDKLLIDHINKHAIGEEAYVKVALCLDDGTHLQIQRAWSINGKKLDQHIVVEKNGVEDKYLGENWNYYIEEILPFGIARFFFFNNEKITQLADDTSFEQIKSSIKSAIGVSTIEKAIAHTDEVIRRKKNEITAFEQSEENLSYQDVEHQIADAVAKQVDIAKQLSEIQFKRDALDVALEAKEAEFWATGGNLSKNRDMIKQEMQGISNEVQRVRTEIVQLAAEPSTPLFLCSALVHQAYNAAIDSQDSTTKEYSDGIVTELYHQLLERLGTCGLGFDALETVKGVLYETMKEHILHGQTQQKVKSLSAAGLLLYQRLIEEILQRTPAQIVQLVHCVEAQEAKLMSLEMHLGSADEKTLAMQLFDALKSLESEKALADAEHRRLLEASESLTRQQEALRAQRIRLLRSIAENEHANDDNARIVKYAAMSIDVLTEFKKRLQREKVSALSDSITACFQKLVGKSTLVRKIHIDPDSLDVTILNSDGNELLKSQLSAGEQQMFAVSVVWALALTSGYQAPVVIDTPMARLDSTHRANFITKYLPAASSQVLVLSTDEEVTGRYLDLIRDNIVASYTLLYHEAEQCTSIVPGYFEEA